MKKRERETKRESVREKEKVKYKDRDREINVEISTAQINKQLDKNWKQDTTCIALDNNLINRYRYGTLCSVEIIDIIFSKISRFSH